MLSENTIWISLVLAIAVPVAIIVGYLNRKEREKGIGWQFIRYTVLSVSIPIVAILALNNALTGEAATLIAGAMGYAFGKNEKN